VDEDRVRAIVRDLIREFEPELKRLGARVDELEARVKALEERTGVAGVPLNISLSYVQDIDSTRDVARPTSLQLADRLGYHRVDISTERQIDENWKGYAWLTWVHGTAVLGRDTNALEVNELYLQGRARLFLLGDTAITAGRQRVKFGQGFLLDTDFGAMDGVRLDTRRLGLDWTFVFADVPDFGFSGYNNSFLVRPRVLIPANDGLFGARVSRSLLGGERLKLGFNLLATGAGEYRAYGADLTLRLFAGNILPEIRAEWVRSLRDMNRNPARGNLFFVDADIFKTNRIALAASWTDTTAGFGDHAVTIYNPFALTAAEALFRRPVAFGAIDSARNVLDDKVFDVRLDIKLFGKNPISVRWFRGDVAGVGRFGNTITVGYRGFKLGDKIALDFLLGNKSAGVVGRQQYVGIAASASL